MTTSPSSVAGRPAAVAGDAGARLGVAEDAVADWLGQVEPASVALQFVDDAQTLLVVPESGQRLGKRHLPGVAEWGVAEVVAQSDRLDQVLVQPQRPPDRPRDLRHLEGVGEAGAVMVARRGDEDLGLAHQPAERLGVDDPVAIALKRRAQIALILGQPPERAPRPRRRRGKPAILPRFEQLPDRHGRHFGHRLNPVAADFCPRLTKTSADRRANRLDHGVVAGMRWASAFILIDVRTPAAPSRSTNDRNRQRQVGPPGRWRAHADTAATGARRPGCG